MDILPDIIKIVQMQDMIAKTAAAISNRLPLTQNKSTLPFNIE